MSANRSRQAQKLAGLLTARTHTKVRLDYHGAVTGGRCWHIKWTDGLSWRKMLAVAAELSDEVPSMDITQMRPARAATPLAEAAAVLVWLNDDEDRADFHPLVWPQYAHDAIGYPEPLADCWRQRGQALLSLTANGSLDPAVLTLLDDHHRHDGWAGALAAAALADARWMLTGDGYSDEDADTIATMMGDSGVDLEDSNQPRGWLRQHGHQWRRSIPDGLAQAGTKC
ncbi:hypothetical protein [Nocardia farcinica]|uniref:hypothetical protein n=2 Tax=Nocardia farcinica TaxID=37329 RepID=UPI0024576097|nr:hypothetical protein [Nocardia farcinica]